MTVTITYQNQVTWSGNEINSFTAGNQLDPQVLGLTGGGFAVAYNNGSLAGGKPAIDFYDANHDLIGTAQLLSTDPNASVAGDPRMTELASGDILVVWDENDVGSDTGAGVVARLFSPDGQALGSEFLLAGISTGYAEPDVVALANGGFVISYDWLGGLPGTYFGVYDSGGVLLGFNSLEQASAQHDSHLAALKGGGFVATWTDDSGANAEVRAQMFNDDGSTRTAAFTLPSAGDNTQPSVAALPGGGFAVAYVSSSWSGAGHPGTGVTLQLFDAEGANVTPGNAIEVNAPAQQNQLQPAVEVLPNGFILVTWTSTFTASDHDIVGRLFTPEGDSVQIGASDTFQIASSGADQTSSSAASLGDGRYIVAYQDSDTDGSGGGVHASLLDLVRNVAGDEGANFVLGDELTDLMDGAGGDDRLGGGGGNDLITGGDGNDVLVGDAGDDQLKGGAGSDTLQGGDGDDVIYASDQIDAGDPSDAGEVDGQAGDDLLWGAAGADTVDGGDGGDSISGLGGADQLHGGEGDDTIFAMTSDLHQVSHDAARIFGDGGDDVLYGSVGADSIDGGLGDDIVWGAGGSDDIHGGEGDDWLLGKGGADLLQGGDGADTLNGGGGDDDLYAAAVGDSSGVNPGDLLIGGDGDDELEGAGGADTLNGGGGDDTMVGGDGADSLIGGAGNDVLFGRHGADTMSGGAGIDTFYFEKLGSTAKHPDLITDLNHLDVIDLSAIDADVHTAKNQAFHQVGQFTGHAGELVVAFHTSGAFAGFTTIEGDTDGDGQADLRILVEGDQHKFHDFVL